MLASLDCYTVTTVRLATSLVPNKIILSINETPWRHQNFFNTIWWNDIANNRIKST